MAKAKQRDISVHSRAARRGEAPPSKDLITKKTPAEQSDYKPWLHSAQNSGIQKKQKKKQLTRAQKLRQQKGLERADENAEKLEKKIADSKKRGQAIKKRNPEWDELNGKLVAANEQPQQERTVKMSADLSKNVAVEKQDRDGDEEMVADLEQPLPDRSADMPGAEEEASKPAVGVPGAPAWVSMHAKPEDLEDINEPL